MLSLSSLTSFCLAQTLEVTKEEEAGRASDRVAQGQVEVEKFIFQP